VGVLFVSSLTFGRVFQKCNLTAELILAQFFGHPIYTYVCAYLLLSLPRKSRRRRQHTCTSSYERKMSAFPTCFQIFRNKLHANTEIFTSLFQLDVRDRVYHELAVTSTYIHWSLSVHRHPTIEDASLLNLSSIVVCFRCFMMHSERNFRCSLVANLDSC